MGRAIAVYAAECLLQRLGLPEDTIITGARLSPASNKVEFTIVHQRLPYTPEGSIAVPLGPDGLNEYLGVGHNGVR